MPRVELPRRLARCLARYAEAAGKSLDKAAKRCLELALAEQRLEAALDEVVKRQKQTSAAAARCLEAAQISIAAKRCFESALDGVVTRQKEISAAAERRLELARLRLALDDYAAQFGGLFVLGAGASPIYYYVDAYHGPQESQQ